MNPNAATIAVTILIFSVANLVTLAFYFGGQRSDIRALKDQVEKQVSEFSKAFDALSAIAIHNADIDARLRTVEIAALAFDELQRVVDRHIAACDQHRKYDSARLDRLERRRARGVASDPTGD